MQRFFSECGVEGVEVDQCVRGDSVEGQSASRTVHIHCCSVRDGGGGGDGCSSLIVTDGVTSIRTAQTPGLIIPSNHTGLKVSSPSDSSMKYQLLLSIRPPSNSDQSEHFYTAADDTSHQICLDDQDMTDPPPHVSPSCCCQTVSVSCPLCLCRW